MRINDLHAAGAITIQNGFPCGNWNDEGTGILQVRPFNVTDGGQIDLSTTKYVETDQKLDAYLLRPNDVIFNNTNSEELVGKTALWKKSDRAVLSNHMTIIRVRQENAASAAFLALYLLYKWYEGHFKMVCRRHVNQASVSRERICDVAIPAFAIAEQRQIAALLSAVQRAIERQERLIALTAELKKALMHKLFTEGTCGERLKQKTRFGPVPASWGIVPLGECCRVQTGIAKGRKVNPEDAIALPYLRVANVQDGRLDLSEVKTITIRKSEAARFSLRPGDVVLTEGGDLDKLGRGFIWHGEVPGCVHQNHIFAVRPDLTRLSSEFIAYQTQSPYGKKYFLSVAHKTTNLACINTSKLKAFPVLVPAAEEQREIVSVLQLLDRRRSAATNVLDSLRSLFCTLLHQLMTAQIRVRDLDLSALEDTVQPAGVTRRPKRSEAVCSP